MSRKVKLWLIIVLVILICVGWFTYAQWNNISAFIDSFRYSQEEVVSKIEETKDSVQKIIDETENVTVRDLTEEEAKALNEGTLSEEEAISILTGQSNSVSNNSDNVSKQEDNVDTKKDMIKEESPAQEDNSTKEPQKESNNVIAESIAKLYIQKNIYLNKLDEIEAHVRKLYIDMSKEERKGAKQRLLTEYLPTVAAWESECDSVVYGILDEIKAAVKANNQDVSIVSKLEEAYLSEKKLKKSYFINRYMD